MKRGRDTGGDYTVVDLSGVDMEESLVRLEGKLDNSLRTRCTNKMALHRITGIGYHRLVYLFVKRGRKVVFEKGYMIIRTDIVYKGSQPGGVRNNRILLRGNEY